MFCEQCGRELKQGEAVCPACGKPAPEAYAGAGQPPPPQQPGVQGTSQPPWPTAPSQAQAPPPVGQVPQQPYTPQTPPTGGARYAGAPGPGAGRPSLGQIAGGVAALCGIMLFVCTILTWVSVGGSFLGISMGVKMSGINLITGDYSYGGMGLDDLNMEDLNMEDLNLEDLNLEDMDMEDLDLEDMEMEELDPEEINLKDTDSPALACANPAGPIGLPGQGRVKRQLMEEEKMPGNFLFRTGEAFLFTGFWAFLFGAVIIAGAALMLLGKKAGGVLALAGGGLGFAAALVNVIMVFTKLRPDAEYSSMVSTSVGAGLWIFLAFSLLAAAAGLAAVLSERSS